MGVDGLVDGLDDGLDEGEVAAPVQVTPLRLNAPGFGLAPVNEPMNPSDDTLPPVGTAPFQLAFVAVTCAPACAQVALQPWVTFCPASGKSNSSFQLVSGSPRLVTATAPWKPFCHWPATV